MSKQPSLAVHVEYTTDPFADEGQQCQIVWVSTARVTPGIVPESEPTTECRFAPAGDLEFPYVAAELAALLNSQPIVLPSHSHYSALSQALEANGHYLTSEVIFTDTLLEASTLEEVSQVGATLEELNVNNRAVELYGAPMVAHVYYALAKAHEG